MKKERQSNIELLKIFAMIGIIILHCNNVEIGGAFKYAQMPSLKAYALYYLECMAISAVDVFMLISGYFMVVSEKIDLKKPLRLLIQVALFREMFYLYHGVMGRTEINLIEMVIQLLPASYFVVLYVAVYLLSPFINHLMRSLHEKGLKALMIVVVLLISVWPYGADVLEHIGKRSFLGLSTIGMYGSQSGYTLVNFIMMYMIGAYLRITGAKGKKLACGAVLVSSWTMMFILSIWLVGRDVSAHLAWEYCSPLVIVSAVSAFLLFDGIRIKSNAVINSLAKATFSVYLFNSDLILLLFNAKEHVSGNGVMMLLHIAWTCVVTCLVCWAIQCAYDWLMKPVYSFIDKYLKLKTVFSLEE